LKSVGQKSYVLLASVICLNTVGKDVMMVELCETKNCSS